MNIGNSTKIEFNDVSLMLRLYTDKGISIKEAIINLFKKSRYIENYKDFWVLNNINLSINEGERLGIIGNNGAGKSTLLKLIAKIYTPTKGNINISGNIVPLIELGAGFNPELTGRENIYLNGAILGYKKDEMQQLEHKIIEFANIEEFIDVPIKYYSTGMYGRLAFAVATEVQPEILIIDEVFASGDMNFVEKAKQRINNLIDSAKIVILVSHSLELISSICSRCIVVSDRTIAFDGEPEEAIEFYKNQNTGV